MFRDKRVLVAGGTGMIGIPTVRRLIQLGARVTVVSLDDPDYARAVLGRDVLFVNADLTDFRNCLNVMRGQEYVFNLVGIKGSVGIGVTRAASYFVPMILFQTCLMDAAFKSGVSRYLFVSSICAYPQGALHHEDRVWDGLPKQNDRYAGVAKRVGELQAETYLNEYGWEAVRIVRPSNVYGPYDDFNPATAQVIPALIGRASNGEDPLTVWGDGTVIRDFIYSEDVANGLLLAIEKAPPCTPINLGSGIRTTIKELAETIASSFTRRPTIQWDPSKPSGDPIRLLSTKRAKEKIGFEARTGIRDGIAKTVEWYLSNRDIADRRRRSLVARAD